MILSKYQEDILSFLRERKGNLRVEAVAGSGKTTTIMKCSEICDKNGTLFVAFNRHIARYISEKQPSLNARTLNSYGNEMLSACFGSRVNEKKSQNIFKEYILGNSEEAKEIFRMRKGAVSRAVSLCKSNLFKEDVSDEELDILCEKFELDLDKSEFDWVRKILEIGNSDPSVIDFDDQIYLPSITPMNCERFNTIFVDEAQDLNPAQIRLLGKMLSEDGILVSVGDSNQAIYGFRGADVDSMGKLESSFGMTRLPLSICYRCSKKVVENARTIVPEMEPFEDAEEGRVETVREKQGIEMLREGDLILCRTAAPLVRMAIDLISKKIPARILGRDLQRDIEPLMKHKDSLDSYAKEVEARYRNRPGVLVQTLDKIDVLKAIISGYGKEESEIRNGCDELFSEEGRGVSLSTVHKAKGLEADRVFLIRPSLIPHPYAVTDWQRKQEQNIKYIAYTRARKELYIMVK